MDARDLIYVARSLYGALLGFLFLPLLPLVRDRLALEAPLLAKVLLVLAALYLPTIPMAWLIARRRGEEVPPLLLVFKGAAGYLAAWFIALLLVYNM